MKRAIQQTCASGEKCSGVDEIKTSRFFKEFVLKGGWLVFLFFLLLNTPSIFGQSRTLLGTVHATLPISDCRNFTVKAGDKVSIDAFLGVPSSEVIPTSMTVTISTGSEFTVSLGNPRVSQLYTIPTSDFSVCVVNLVNFDSDDSGRADVYLEPRPNLTALPPQVQPNGDLIYGYRVGDRAWDPRTNNVPVELSYYNQTTKKYTLIAAHGMRLEANATESIPIRAAQVPTVPPGTTHLVVRVDKNDDIPESNEDDNVQFFPLPKSNLIVTSLAYDSANRITVGYQFNSVMPVIPPNIQLKLNYATGTRFSDIVRDYPALKEMELSPQDLPRNTLRQITLNVGEYLLPTSEATHLLASIDLPDDRLPEDNPNDNIKTVPVQIAPGYTRLTVGRGSGVAIYQKGNYFVTVVDLTKATLASSLNRETAFGSIGYHFKKGLRGNTSRRSLKVALNGTFFKEEIYRNLQTGFTYGLKHNGKGLDFSLDVAEGGSGVPAQFFTFERGSASIISHLYTPYNNSRYRNLAGVLAPPSQTSTVAGNRNVVGLRDEMGNGAIGETRYRTLLIFSTIDAITFNQVRSELGLFGAQRLAQLDSGSSTNLMAASGNKGKYLLRARFPVIPPDFPFLYRPLPHAILIYGGQQLPRAAQLTVGSSAIISDNDLPSSFNVVAIKKNDTQSNRTELSVLSGDGEFANIFNQLPTGFYPTDDNFQFLLGDWDLDGYTDLFGIKKQLTGAGKTEVHILSGATGYSKFVLQVATGLHETDDQWKFALADWDGDRRPDLFCIRRAGGASGRVEVHVLSAASNYQQFILNTPTVFQYAGDNFDFHIADWDGDSRPDLIAIKKNQTGAGHTEIHIASGASGFGNFILQIGTALHETDSTWSFAVTDWDGGGRVDLVGFKKLNTGTNSTEIHVLQGENQFQNFILQIGTALPNTGQETNLLLADNAVVGDYDPLAKRYAYTGDGIYLFRNDEILKYTGEAPSGWRMIDSNSAISAIASTSDSFFQIQSQSGSIFRYDGTNSSWQPISTDSNNIAIAATSESLYVLQRSGAVLKYTGTGWALISQDPLTRAIVATDEALFQMHSTGRILRLDGNSWTTVSTSYSTRQIVATQDDILALRNSGEVFVYTGSDWKVIGNDTNTVSISTDGETIYRQLANGQVFRYYGQPMIGWKLVGWQ
jgi:hypothetical protein